VQRGLQIPQERVAQEMIFGAFILGHDASNIDSRRGENVEWMGLAFGKVLC
jgi:hypothetical protein